MLKVARFQVEYRDNPIGLDEKTPRFSWVLEADGQNVTQRTYHLKVTDADNAIVWDSGEVESEQSVLVEYAGENLLPRTEYRVFLTVTDNRYERAVSSITFSMGLLGKQMKGDFISRSFGDVVPCFKKNFSVSKKVRRAYVFATALGVYEIFLNGKRVGDAYDAPGWTSYSHRLQYQAYDVTKLLEKKNEFSVLVGKGWYAGKLGYFHRKNCYGEKCALCLDLYLEFEDGTEKIIKTDESWKASESALRFSEFQDGEVYDSTFAPEQEYPVEIVAYDKKNLLGQIDEPIRITEVIAGKKLISTPKGETVIDFGQNASGIVEFTVKGKYGQKVKISHAEVLDEAGNFYTENLRGAKAEDVYILNGEMQTLKPHFTTHGFRFIKVEGFDEVKADDFRLLVLHTDMAKTGEFHCENPLVDKLQQNIVWGQRGNFLDIPTDCPQRDERLGWTGDAQVFCRTASFNYNVAPFFAKWLGDLAAEQTKESGVGQTIPNIVPGNERGAAAWGDAATICPWTIYKVYGDKRILERQYESMKGWVEYIRARSTNDLWQCDYQYGDWLALDREGADNIGLTDKYFIASAYYAYSCELVAKTAEVLGKKKDWQEYSALHERIVRSIRKEYVTERGRLVTETQTACVLALGFGLIQDEFRSKIAALLRTKLKERDDHLATGFVGTPYLCHVLSENGLHDVAAQLLLNKDYPSWLYEVKMGATTIWERWNAIYPDGTIHDPGMSSFNHYAYGSVGDWMYRKVAGIDCLAAGYKKIQIKPMPIEELGAVQARYQCPYGEIAVSYTVCGGKIVYSIRIPVNTTAQVELPDGQKYEVGSGEYRYETSVDVLPMYGIPNRRQLRFRLRTALENENVQTCLSENCKREEFQKLSLFEADKTLAEIKDKYPHLAEIVMQTAAILAERSEG